MYGKTCALGAQVHNRSAGKWNASTRRSKRAVGEQSGRGTEHFSGGGKVPVTIKPAPHTLFIIRLCPDLQATCVETYGRLDRAENREGKATVVYEEPLHKSTNSLEAGPNILKEKAWIEWQ